MLFELNNSPDKRNIDRGRFLPYFSARSSSEATTWHCAEFLFKQGFHCSSRPCFVDMQPPFYITDAMRLPEILYFRNWKRLWSLGHHEAVLLASWPSHATVHRDLIHYALNCSLMYCQCHVAPISNWDHTISKEPPENNSDAQSTMNINPWLVYFFLVKYSCLFLGTISLKVEQTSRVLR